MPSTWHSPWYTVDAQSVLTPFSSLLHAKLLDSKLFNQTPGPIRLSYFQDAVLFVYESERKSPTQYPEGEVCTCRITKQRHACGIFQDAVFLVDKMKAQTNSGSAAYTTLRFPLSRTVLPCGSSLSGGTGLLIPHSHLLVHP